MRKILLIALLIFTAFTAESQAFHFNNTSTTLVKTTDQSPAHWYIEVFNDAGVDTTLRWKASFSNVPPQWNVNFDDQDNYYATVNDGDSADFTLFSGLSFPQKLIIGAAFNGVPGNATIFFDIYDPADPSNVVTISYIYIVTLADLQDLAEEDLVKRNLNYLIFDKSLIGGTVQLVNENGQVITESQITDQVYFEELNNPGLFTVLIKAKDQIILRREYIIKD